MSGVSTATAIGLGLSGASLGLTAVGTLSKMGASTAGGASSAAAAMYQAQVAKNNQIIADESADKAIQSGLVAADIQSKKGVAVEGNVKASQAANGIDVNTGSAVGVRQGVRMATKINSETALNNAEWTGWGYRSRAAGYGAESGLDEMSAGSAIAGGNAGATGALIGGGGSILQNASQLPFGKIFGSGNTSADPTGSIRTANDADLAGGGGNFGTLP